MLGAEPYCWDHGERACAEAGMAWRRRCSDCGGVLAKADRPAGRHSDCRGTTGVEPPPGGAARNVSLTLYPAQIAKLDRLGKNRSETVRRLIDEA